MGGPTQMKFGNEEISLSETFRRIYENRDDINERIERMIEQWEKEDEERLKKLRNQKKGVNNGCDIV